MDEGINIFLYSYEIEFIFLKEIAKDLEGGVLLGVWICNVHVCANILM
jgi:hypothetical protein